MTGTVLSLLSLLILIWSPLGETGWSAWESWQDCALYDSRCVQLRFRRCEVPREDCDGEAAEETSCASEECQEERCPPREGMIRYDNRWYLHIDEKDSFEDAAESCADLGMTLARVREEEEYNSLVDFIGNFVGVDTWINVMNPDEDFSCSDAAACNNKLTDSEGRPIPTAHVSELVVTTTNKFCVKLKPDGKLEHSTCTKVKPPICQSTCGDPTTHLCPPALGMEAVGDKYFLIGEKGRSFVLGERFCTDYGLKLASISTEKDYLDVAGYIDDKEDAWVNVHNPDGVSCNNDACASLLFTVDDEAIANVSYIYGVNANPNHGCLQLKNENLRLEGRSCTDKGQITLCEGYCDIRCAAPQEDLAGTHGTRDAISDAYFDKEETVRYQLKQVLS